MAEPATGASAGGGVTAFRWVILLLVFSATAINYLDRQIIALLKPVLEEEFNWTDTDYGHVVSAFQFSAAVAYLFVGWFIDRVGLRWGYALSVGIWSVVAMLHAAGRTVTDFVVARVVLGVSEAGNTPAAVKAIANWFPVRERAFALGVMNSGSNSGAIIAPLVVPALALAFGWRMAFILTGATGLVWLVAWLAIRRQPPADVAAAASAEPPRRVTVSWGPLMRDRRVWAIASAKMLTDAVWWFLLFWLPDFLHRVYDLDLKTFGLPLATVYAMATVGALSAGALPAVMLNRGVSLNAARKISLLVAAILVLPLPLALDMHSAWSAVLIVGIGLAAHQGFSTNVFALATDLFPREIVATVVSIGALFGNIGGLIILELTGRVLDATGSYTPMFVYCAGAYLAALALVHVLVPRIQAPAAHAGT